MRIVTTSALVALGLTLGACGGPVNRGLESVHQPVVSRTDYVFDAGTDASTGLAPGEAQRLTGWFDSLELGYGDRVAIDVGSGYGSAAVRDDVARVLARYGLLLADAAPVTSGTVPPGAIRIVVSRTGAEVPNCPDWSRPSQPEFAGSTMSNFGCAVNSNLAAMVADPQDLVRGRDSGPSDARTVTRAIKTYREAEPTGKNQQLNTQSTRSGE